MNRTLQPFLLHSVPSGIFTFKSSSSSGRSDAEVGGGEGALTAGFEDVDGTEEEVYVSFPSAAFSTVMPLPEDLTVDDDVSEGRVAGGVEDGLSVTCLAVVHPYSRHRTKSSLL